jgi:hypothetical protein
MMLPLESFLVGFIFAKAGSRLDSFSYAWFCSPSVLFWHLQVLEAGNRLQSWKALAEGARLRN